MASKAYRDAYVEQSINNRLAAQIYSLRAHRDWTQADLSDRSGMAQPRISTLETSCSGVSLNTLKRLASAFDVALVVKFVPFSELTREVAQGRIDRNIPNFEVDAPAFGAVKVYQITASSTGSIAQFISAEKKERSRETKYVNITSNTSQGTTNYVH
jgi:transcriptional regulator with XRE-family HTH domain